MCFGVLVDTKDSHLSLCLLEFGEMEFPLALTARSDQTSGLE